jgi:P pilus assembly chaperone PapD
MIRLIVLILALTTFTLLTFSTACDSNNIYGTWKLVEEKKMYDDSESLSIFAVPKSEQNEDDKKDEVRQIELQFSEPNKLITIDNGFEQKTTFNLNGKELKLGNREYKVVELTSNKLIISHENLSGEVQLIFEKE